MDGNLFFGGEVPEDVKQELLRRRMEAQDAQNEMWDFLLTLSPEQLMLVRNLLAQVISDKRYAHNLLGVVTAIFRLKHDDRCGGCGKNHDAELLEGARTEMGLPPIE